MGEYWQLMLPDLPELIEAKTKQKAPASLTPEAVYAAFDGKWSFYRPMLHDMVMRDLSKSAHPREPIYTTDFGVVETNKGYTLSCMVYFIPDGHFQNGIKPVVVKGIAPVDESAVDASVHQTLEGLRASQSMEREKKGDNVVIEDGDMAWCTLEPRIDGKLWGVGVLKSARVVVSKLRLQPESLYEAFLGKGVGNHKVQFTLPPKFGPLAGKVVDADLIVHGVLSYVLPDWNDELAQKLGKPTLDELRKTQYEDTKRRFVEAWENKVADQALMGLIEQVTFDPVPTEWVRMKAKEHYDRMLSAVRGKKKDLLATLGVDNDDTAMLQMYDMARKEAWSVIALLSYGKHVGLEREEGETIGHLSEYLRRSIRHLIDHHVEVVP
jgi:hypothetical protein